ncbi:hypothetical protein BX600DRAFT_480475 [Xylariales sp. PMI_506]|nr:hypothetical protein BX600DRAFT_480475 [Xylariales sp. PMI_506]
MGTTALSKKQSSRLRQLATLCFAFFALSLLLLRSPEPSTGIPSEIPVSSPAKPASAPSTPALSDDTLNNRFLSAEQCAYFFPGLTSDIDDVVAKGQFTLKHKGSLGPLIGRIQDGKLSILQAAPVSSLSADMISHRLATLHQIHSAIITAPDPSEIPNTIFAFNHNDDPLSGTFSYSQPADPARNGPSDHYFPIPHFSHWSWNLPFIGSLPRAAAAISRIEGDGSTSGNADSASWGRKIAKAVWRGTPHFGNTASSTTARQRQDLLLSTKDKPWADIEALKWTLTQLNATSRTASNALPIEDFCRYKYIVHTEGLTYSGRLPFHALCASVVLTPPLAWLQPHERRLFRPVFSSDLGPNVTRTPRPAQEIGREGSGIFEKVKLAPYPARWVREAWGTGHQAEEANVIFVAPDWSDLEAVIAYLEDNPDVAKGIARRQRELWHGGGYLSPAAEACYWRAALRGWAGVVRFEDQFKDLFARAEGVPFEEFVVGAGTR